MSCPAHGLRQDRPPSIYRMIRAKSRRYHLPVSIREVVWFFDPIGRPKIAKRRVSMEERCDWTGLGRNYRSITPPFLFFPRPGSSGCAHPAPPDANRSPMRYRGEATLWRSWASACGCQRSGVADSWLRKWPVCHIMTLFRCLAEGGCLLTFADAYGRGYLEQLVL